MQRMLRVVVLVSAGAGCTASSPPPAPVPAPPPSSTSPTPPTTGSAMPVLTLPEAPPAGPWSLVVLDGSANRFTLEGRDGVVRHTFTPVTPAMSSSGVYSGGAPRTGEVDAATAAAVWALARAALLDGERHASARAMGTTVIRVDVADGVREVIVTMGGADALLAALRALP